MYQIQFTIGEMRWQVDLPKLDHGALLTAIGKSRLLGRQEVWFGDPEYSDDGTCEAAIIVNGDRVVGRFIARPVRDPDTSSAHECDSGSDPETVIVAVAGPCPKMPMGRVSRVAASDVIPF